MIAFKSLSVLSYSLQNDRFILQFKLCKLVAESFQILLLLTTIKPRAAPCFNFTLSLTWQPYESSTSPAQDANLLGQV